MPVVEPENAAEPESSQETADPVVIIGAGPAGLTAALELVKFDRPAVVLEADDVVGGISRTVERDGWRFDIGGHRFFTKVGEVEEAWHEILGPKDFVVRPRLSRIYYKGKFFDYPLKASNALRGLGIIEAVRCVLSYAWVQVRPPKDQTTFEGWVAAKFGWRLYTIFFKTYTEKVWGVPGSELQADWAAQRIKNLSLGSAIINALIPKRGTDITSLIERFHYPRLGPGQMWERATEIVEAAGTKVHMETPVTQINIENGRAVSVVAETAGAPTTFEAQAVISSMPMGALLRAISPPPPDDVLAAANGLRYRDFLTVALVVPESCGFPDNWIYVHSPEVRLGRIQNFGAWSPDMVKDGRTCLGLEYFVNEGDDLWEMSDDDLIELGEAELQRIGLAQPGMVEVGYVVRMPKAYPVYDDKYVTQVETMRSWLEANASNVIPVGRNGMHRYNNQDHSMYTAMLAVRNLEGDHHDLWAVNVEDEYHEEKTGRDAPLMPAADELPKTATMARTLVIPMYNEAARIGSAIEQLAHSTLPNESTEIVLVDDGSIDDTLLIARETLGDTRLDARIVELGKNHGKGAAVRAGIMAARGESIVFSDADLSAGPEQIERIFGAVESGIDVALASRLIEGSHIVRQPPWSRRIGGKIYNTLLRILRLTAIPDTQCGLKGFSRDAARSIFPAMRSQRFSFDVEVIAHAERAGLKVEQVPVVWSHVPASSVHLMRDGAGMASDAVRLRRSLGK